MTKQDNRCEEQVFSVTPGNFKPRQCSKPAGHGEGGRYCSEHSRNTKDIAPSNEKRKTKDRLWR